MVRGQEWLLLRSLSRILVQRGEGVSRQQGPKGTLRWELCLKPEWTEGVVSGLGPLLLPPFPGPLASRFCQGAVSPLQLVTEDGGPASPGEPTTRAPPVPVVSPTCWTHLLAPSRTRLSLSQPHWSLRFCNGGEIVGILGLWVPNGSKHSRR